VHVAGMFADVFKIIDAIGGGPAWMDRLDPCCSRAYLRVWPGFFVGYWFDGWPDVVRSRDERDGLRRSWG